MLRDYLFLLFAASASAFTMQPRALSAPVYRTSTPTAQFGTGNYDPGEMKENFVLNPIAASGGSADEEEVCEQVLNRRGCVWARPGVTCLTLTHISPDPTPCLHSPSSTCSLGFRLQLPRLSLSRLASTESRTREKASARSRGPNLSERATDF